MSLQLEAAITDGLERAATKTGVLLAGVFFLLQLLMLSSLNTTLAGFVPPDAAVDIGLTLPVPAAVGAVILFVSYLLSMSFFVVLTRAVSRPSSELSTVPRELYTRRIGWATLSTLVAGVLSLLAIMLGLVFLLLPGLFLAISFMFFVFAIGIEDRGTLESLSRSWELSSGNRVNLGLLLLLLGAVGLFVSGVGSVFELRGLPAVADFASAAINSISIVVSYAIIAAAYLQLAEAADDPVGGT